MLTAQIMLSSTKAILLLFSTVINPGLAHYGGTNTQENYFLDDTNVLCYNLTYVNPLIYYVSNFDIKCVSPQPIHWDVAFKLSDKGAKMVMPYRVESEWKSCRNQNQADMGLLAQERYFEIVLRFHENQKLNSTQSILIKCVNTLNITLSDSWNTSIDKGTVNLNGVLMKMPASVKPENKQLSDPLLCEHNIILTSDSTRSQYNCLFSKFRSIELKPVHYFECDNWINCQQLAAFKFKKPCPTVAWQPAFCDSGYPPCEHRGKLVSTSAGIIYCTWEDETFYLPYFKNPSDDVRKTLYIISDVRSDSLALVSLTKQQTNEILGPNVTNVGFKCSAPKFIALEGFEWTAIYNTNLTEESCNTTSFETLESYNENFNCPISNDGSPSEINVTCTVHLQTGKIVHKTVSGEYHFNDSAPDTTGTWVNILYAVAGTAGCFGILLTIIIYCNCKIRGQGKQTLISAKDVEIFLKGTVLPNTVNKPQSAIVLPYDVGLEIPREKIKFETILLGKGAFGEVMKGKIGQRCVAIKTVNRTVDGPHFRALLSELKIMSFVGKHTNIVELVGANTERIRKQDVILIFEFCENGNVLEFIRARRETFVDQFNLCESSNAYNVDSTMVEYENCVWRKFCSEDLIRWGIEIATGMDFIASKNVYHGDLAARNILLTHHLVAKVGDFGLAKDLKDYALYVQGMNCPLPLKWMSIESLRDLEFSIQSDVWSFGITMWEIFSLGSKPYPGVEWNFQAWKRLQDGERMDRPSRATQSIHDILLKCWETLPQDRPTFSELKQMFKCELDKLPTC